MSWEQALGDLEPLDCALDSDPTTPDQQVPRLPQWHPLAGTPPLPLLNPQADNLVEVSENQALPPECTLRPQGQG